MGRIEIVVILSAGLNKSEVKWFITLNIINSAKVYFLHISINGLNQYILCCLLGNISLSILP